ncbi:MAG TPA: protein-disulfide reductase DsbD domain-containing protein [Puia sp.]|jgi:thiol:disulfide interchange protein DsbD|nr:protein-disulfide reductase DsbD domain-containing protein [Puia sp.]
MNTKKITLFGLALLMGTLVMAQGGSATQVQWTYSTKKISDKVYEVHMMARIGAGWHMYSQNGGDGPVSTSFSFTKNPLLAPAGKVKEVGKMVTKFEEAFKSNVRYYENAVDFVQTVQLKSKAKTSLAGKVEFMVCNDHECLPPTDVNISVNIGG